MSKVVLAAAAVCLFAGAGRSMLKAPVAPPSPQQAMVVAVSAPAPSSGAISLHADRSGHFTTSALINGRTTSMLVDTGATNCAFREEEAESLGIRLTPKDFTRMASTANGVVAVAPVRIKLLQIGPVAVRDVEAVVIPRGRLGANLLGMSFLSRLREFNVAGTRITLRG